MNDKSVTAPWKCRLRRTIAIGPRIASETTPFVFNNRLFRVENHPRRSDFPDKEPTYRFLEDEIRIRDVETDRIMSVPLQGHYFGHGFPWNGRLYLFAGDYENGRLPWWHIKRIVITSSEDLIHWSEPRVVIESENGECLFNTAVCRGKDKYIMLYETDDDRFKPFTFKYCESDDLIHWTRIPGAIYGKDKYVGGPALYYEGGRYYTLYLQVLEEGKYETRITRSLDLISWEDAPEGRPFLSFNPDYRPDVELHPEVYELSASDAELCFWKGRTIVYFNGGNQQGVGSLQVAEFDGTPRELLEHYYV